MDDFERPAVMNYYLSEKPGDQVVQRGGKTFIVRVLKRGQEFNPNTTVDSLDIWSLVLGVIFGGLRRIPPLLASGWQSGVIRIDPTAMRGLTVLEKRKFGSRQEAVEYAGSLLRRVNAGELDAR